MSIGSLFGVGLIEEAAKLIFPIGFYLAGRNRSESKWNRTRNCLFNGLCGTTNDAIVRGRIAPGREVTEIPYHLANSNLPLLATQIFLSY